MDIRLITPPTEQPVSLDEAKEHLYVTDDDHDQDIRRKVKAATVFCQRRVPGHRQFMAATYDASMADFPIGDQRITLPFPPLHSVVKIDYYNSSGTLVQSTAAGSTFSSTGWIVVKPTDKPGYIEPAFNKVWPTTRERPDAVTVRFVAGSTTTQTVSDDAKLAVLTKLEHLWDPERVTAADAEKTVDGLMHGLDYGFYG